MNENGPNGYDFHIRLSLVVLWSAFFIKYSYISMFMYASSDRLILRKFKTHEKLDCFSIVKNRKFSYVKFSIIYTL